MKARYPRTAGEFEEHHRCVGLPSETCGKQKSFVQDTLIAMLSCWMCGQGLPALTFHDPTKKSYVPVTFEEALAYDLELRAFARAREADEPRRRRLGRVRKVGRR